MRSRVIAALGIVVTLAVIVLLAAPAFINTNRYRPQIEAKLQQRLGRNVSLGPMRLSLLPLEFRVDNAVVAEDAQFNTGRPFMQVQTLFVRPELLPLIHHDVKIKSLQLSRPVVELVRNAQGRWNFSNLLQDRQQTQDTAGLSLDKLQINDGQIALTDIQQRKPRAVYNHIDLAASDLAPGKATSIDLKAHLPGPGDQTAALNGRIGPFQSDVIEQTPFDGTLKLDKVSLSALKQFLNAEGLADSEATLTGNAGIKNKEGVLSSNGTLDAANPRVRGVDTGYPIHIDYQIDANLNQSTAEIHKADLKLGPTPVSLSGKINAQTTPAQIDLTVQTTNASITEPAKLAAAFGAAIDPKTNFSGNVTVKLHALGDVTRPAMTGALTARDLSASGGEFREPVHLTGVDLSFEPNVIRSNQFTAKTGQTTATGLFNLSDYTSDNPKLEVTLSTNDAKMDELLRIGKAYGISAVQGMNGSGLLTLNVAINGPLKQTGQLTFNGNGNIRNATLEGPSIAKPIAVRKADMQFTGNGVNLNDLDVSIGQTTAHGTLVVSDFGAPQVRFSISANHINVAEWEQLFKAVPSKPARPHAAATLQIATSADNLFNRAMGSGSLTVDRLVYDDLALTQVKSDVTLDHGVITMNPLTADLYNGQQSGKVIIDTRATPVSYTVDSRLQGVDANQLLSTISPVKEALYGLLSANADTHFTTAAGARSILPTLSGKVSINLKDGKIANVDLLHHLWAIGQFKLASRAIEPFTQLTQLTGDFDIKNGVAQTNDLKAAIEAGSVAAAGTIDLAQERLDLHLTAVLSQNYSQSVGGVGIGGFLNTALANTNGELVMPVLVTGTLQNPQFAPDLQRIAEMKVKNLLPGTDNPAALTKGILGQVLRGKPGQTGEPAVPAVSVPGLLQNLLDSIGKKK